MNEANVLASLKTPRLLIVARFQNRIALLLAPVLPLQVVVPWRLRVRPPPAVLVFAPVIATSLARSVVPGPKIEPPVQVATPWKVWLLPLSVLPLSRNGVVWVPP